MNWSTTRFVIVRTSPGQTGCEDSITSGFIETANSLVRHLANSNACTWVEVNRLISIKTEEDLSMVDCINEKELSMVNCISDMNLSMVDCINEVDLSMVDCINKKDLSMVNCINDTSDCLNNVEFRGTSSNLDSFSIPPNDKFDMSFN